MMTSMFVLLDSHMRQLARLLQCNYRAQEQEYGEAHASLQGLKDLPVIPLADGRLVTLSSGGVFFPLSEEGEVQKGTVLSHLGDTHTHTLTYTHKYKKQKYKHLHMSSNTLT